MVARLSEDDDLIVTGRVRLPAKTAPNAVLRLAIEDVSRADAPAGVVARLALPAAAAVDGEIEFRIPAPAIGNRRSYTVRAHLDQNGSGKVSAGDHVSAAAYPISSADHDADPIALERVR